MGRLDGVSAQDHCSVIEIVLCSEPSGIEGLGSWRAQGIVMRDYLAPIILGQT